MTQGREKEGVMIGVMTQRVRRPERRLRSGSGKRAIFTQRSRDTMPLPGGYPHCMQGKMTRPIRTTYFTAVTSPRGQGNEYGMVEDMEMVTGTGGRGYALFLSRSISQCVQSGTKGNTRFYGGGK
jgi:hypothetical protein